MGTEYIYEVYAYEDEKHANETALFKDLIENVDYKVEHFIHINKDSNPKKTMGHKLTALTDKARKLFKREALTLF